MKIPTKTPGKRKFKRWLDEPILWEDADGYPHIVIDALLRKMGMEDTPENVDKMTEFIYAELSKEIPTAKFITRPKFNSEYSISPDGSSITCLTCLKTSHNLNDVKNRYCGFCHKFLEDTP